MRPVEDLFGILLVGPCFEEKLLRVSEAPRLFLWSTKKAEGPCWAQGQRRISSESGCRAHLAVRGPPGFIPGRSNRLAQIEDRPLLSFWSRFRSVQVLQDLFLRFGRDRTRYQQLDKNAVRARQPWNCGRLFAIVAPIAIAQSASLGRLRIWLLELGTW